MVFIAVDPKTNKVKEYRNSGEWLKEVDQVKTTIEKPIEVKTYADASKRLKKELGIDLRTPAEKEQARLDASVGKAVSAALAHQQATTQSPPVRQETHGPKSLSDLLTEFSRLTGWKLSCGCSNAKHSQKAEAVSHSQYGVGPTMTAEAVSWEVAQSRLRAAGIEP